MKGSAFNKSLSSVARVAMVKNGDGVSRVRSMIKVILDPQCKELLPLEKYCFSLLLLDGVPLQDIEIASSRLPTICPDGITISWTLANGRVERFLLSSISAQIISKISEKDLKAFDATKLSSIYQSIFHRKSLKNDQSAWIALHFPGPLYEHFCGRLKMSALSDSAYARLQKQAALHDELKSADESNIMQPFAHVFESTKLDRNTVFVEEIIYACRRRPGKSNAQAKVMMLSECQKLVSILDEYGPSSALILAWAMSLIDHGTRSQSDLSQASISNYIGTLGKPLFSQLKLFDLHDLEAIEFVKCYQQLIEQSSLGQQNIMASAISAFHAFLEDWFGVLPIYKGQYHQDIETPPKSNVIWPHEIATILKWLDHATCDQRLVTSWRLALMLASHQRLRVGELYNLRLEDIHFYASHAEVLITSGKTFAAKRCLKVEGENVVRVLASMVKTRQLEMALPSDYLFGDPAKPSKVYKLGQFYWGLNQLLKQVTGDKSVSFHTLSHTVISSKLITPLVGGEDDFKNPLHQLATDFGHYSILTSCYSYMHFHHLSVRKCMDRALKMVDISSRIAESWSSKTAFAMRKQTSLKQMTPNQYYWECIFAYWPLVETFNECDGNLDLSTPVPPELLSSNPIFKFEDLIYILKDLAAGVPTNSILSRHVVDLTTLNQILDAVKSILAEYQFIFHQKTRSDVLVVLQNLKNKGFDFEKIEQAKYLHLRDCLKSNVSPLLHHIQDATLGWLALPSYKRYQAINDQIESLNFISFLKNAGIEITKIAVFIADDKLKQQRINSIKKLFLMVYSISPPIFLVEPRRGRPPAYITVTEKRVTADCPPYGAANCMLGFKSIMLTLSVLMRVGA